MNTTQKTAPLGARMLKVIVPVLILAVGGAAAFYFVATAPKAKKKRPTVQAPLVEAVSTTKTSVPVTVTAMGTVIPSREVTLTAQVTGNIIKLSDGFEPGGVLKAGEVVLGIDSRDYAIAVRSNKSAVTSAKADLELEMGNQEVARKELEYMKKTAPQAVANTTLALRVPQLEQAEAALEQAEANLEQAKLDLARTTVRAPFNAVVTERSVNLGSYASSQSALATLVGTDEYWVEVAVPLGSLKLMNLANMAGIPVQVTSQTAGGQWQGHTVRLTGTFTDTTRMAKLLVAVKDPLGLAAKTPRQPLMLGDYVRVEISGKQLENVVALPRPALRDNDTVWIAKSGELSIRPVKVAWKSNDMAYVNAGLTEGEKVIVSDFTAAAEGMPLRVSMPDASGSLASAKSSSKELN